MLRAVHGCSFARFINYHFNVTAAPPPFILGLSGGIGAGKSTAARILADLGAHVIDFDALAQAALDDPRVRSTLAQWWGDAILSKSTSTIDRAAVASRVFNNPDERRRLESLIHPIVWRTKAQAQAEAVAAGKPLAVMDAPLLFEAGLDRECDAVLFIDADREIRLERVRHTRGWDDAELHRRETAQFPVPDKMARSRFVVQNNASPAELALAIRRILDIILVSPLTTPRSGPHGPAE